MRILITGASGSGTSTLGTALAEKRGARFFEADDFFWMPTDPPYREKRIPEERLSKIITSLECHEESVVAGSVMAWGNILEHSFKLVVFLQVPTSERLARLVRRETKRFGKVDPEFLEWARQYDEGPPEGRSLAKHNTWLQSLRCPIVRLVGAQSVAEQLRALEVHLSNA